MEKVYSRINWKNGSRSTDTPLNETNMNLMDSAIDVIDDRVCVHDAQIQTLQGYETRAAQSAAEALQSAQDSEDSATDSANSATESSQSASASALSASSASASATSASQSASSASTSETNASQSETNALASERNAKTSEDNAKESEENAETYQNNALIYRDLAYGYRNEAQSADMSAQQSALNASTSETNASASATLSQSYAVGGTNTRTGEDTDNAKYYKEQAQRIVDEFDASDVDFDNTGTSSSATNVQDALTEALSATVPTASDVPYDNTTSGMSATNVQGAIDESLAENETAISSAAAWMVYENNKSNVRKYFVVSTNSADMWTYRGRGTTGRGNTDKVVVFMQAGGTASQYGFMICAIGTSESAVTWANPTPYGDAIINSFKTKRGNTLYIGTQSGTLTQHYGSYGSATIDGVTYDLIPIANPSTESTDIRVASSINAISRIAEDILVYDMAYTHLKQKQVVPSHIGQIIETTTLDTLEKVQAIYGSNTTWIQHSGYVLRGATSGVVANSATKTGGNDSVSYTPSGSNSGGAVTNTSLTSIAQIPSHNHNSKTLTGSFTVRKYGTGTEPTNISGDGTGIVATTSETWSGSHGYISAGNNMQTNPTRNKVTITATHTHDSQGGTTSHGHGFTQPTFSGTATTINTLPSYKSVYIWERTA